MIEKNFLNIIYEALKGLAPPLFPVSSGLMFTGFPRELTLLFSPALMSFSAL